MSTPQEPVRVFTSMNLSLVELIRAGLESSGIKVYLLGQDMHFLVGELPFVEATSGLYVSPDDAAAAQLVVQSMQQQHDMSNRPEWTCPECEERLDGVFTECWNCAPTAAEQPEA